MLRHLLCWKFGFYGLLLPALRRLGPARADAVLGGLGRLIATLWPPRRRELTRSLERAKHALDASWSPDAVRPALAANWVRFLARDLLLDDATDDDVLARFEVRGDAELRAAMGPGRGAILVGSHLGGHVAALHWLVRRGVPLRLLVQRPRHVSKALDRHFDLPGPHAQSGFFLRRDLSPGLATERMLRARSALRDGLAVYLSGDIPWSGPNTRPGRLLGRPQPFLSVWADLAVLTRAPVFLTFCTHLPGGRYALAIEPLGTLAPGGEEQAVAHYLARLESEVAAHPADAVPHLLWPCYAPPAPRRAPAPFLRRRVATATQP